MHHLQKAPLGSADIRIQKYVAIMFCHFMYCQTETVINLQDEEGFTPLMWAAAHGQIAVVEFLLQNVSTNCLDL